LQRKRYFRKRNTSDLNKSIIPIKLTELKTKKKYILIAVEYTGMSIKKLSVSLGGTLVYEKKG
jgi:hypothetical protein